MSFIISLVLTLLVFSYLLGDNILYRLALSIFVGLAAAFTAVVTFQSVILPLTVRGNLSQGAFSLNIALLSSSAALALLLVVKNLRPETSNRIGIIRLLGWLLQILRVVSKSAMAVLIAIGAAAAVVGAVSGTIIPIATDTAKIDFGGNIADILNSITLFVGVVCSLLYFQYSSKASEDNISGERGRVMTIIATIGQGFIVVALGALYGAAILTSLTILSGQLEMLLGV
jgi:hypothetical protein